MIPRLVPTLLALLLSVVPLSASWAEGFTGAGSTFAHPVLAKWAKAFAGQEGDGGAVVSVDDGLDYEPIGSLGGVIRVIQREVDFGAMDAPLTPEELAKRGLDQFPLVTGGVAVVVNVKGVASGTLRLSGALLARIYLGEVTRWSDLALASLNPGMQLTNAPIVVVRRSDGSGTTYNFAAYLAGASAEWRSRVGVDTLLVWPAGMPAKGNQELAERVRATENSIGYVEASQAARLGLSVVMVGNRAGNFVAPTPASLSAALATTVWDPGRHFYTDAADPSGAEAYPITATV